MSPDNFNPGRLDYNIYLYVGNGSDQRLDEGGTVLVTGGTAGKGWVRYRLRNLSPEGDSVYGDFSVSGARMVISALNSSKAELIIPKNAETPTSGTAIGSVRWNTERSIIEAWSGVKWDTTTKVSVSDTAPPSPSNGDVWLSPGPPSTLYVYVVPSVGPAQWVVASSGAVTNALQPGNGVTSNSQNQIEIIDQGPF